MKDSKSNPETEANPYREEELAQDIFSDLQELDEMTRTDAVPTKPLLASVPIGKPPKDTFVRCHPSHIVTLYLYKDEETGESYMLPPSLAEVAQRDQAFRKRDLRLAVTVTGAVFIWETAMRGGETGANNTWNISMWNAQAAALDNWVRVVSNRQNASYDIMVSESDLGEPAYPEEQFNEILRVAFRNKVIETLDHPILKKLRGES
jgi:hypothetical protein